MPKLAVAQTITPAPMRALSPDQRQRIEDKIEGLIAVLDSADGDLDLEDGEPRELPPFVLNQANRGPQ